MNLLVAQSSHFPQLGDFIRIVLGAEWLVPLTIRVNTIENVVVVEPAPVFLHHPVVQLLGIHFGGATGRPIQPVRQQGGQRPVTSVIQSKSIDRLCLLLFVIQLLGRIKNINERELMTIRHSPHSLRIQRQMSIFLPAVRQVAGRRKIFKSSRRNQNQPRSRLTIVPASQRVLDKCRHLSLKVGHARRTRERFIVPIQRENRVGL